jgi:hypothetical protein
MIHTLEVVVATILTVLLIITAVGAHIYLVFEASQPLGRRKRTTNV